MQKELSRVEQFERIRRDRREEALSIRALARRHGVHRRAVRQALAAATPPPKRVPPRASPVLGPHLATVRRWLIEDRSAPRKQRHTARRIWERLVDEEGAAVAEPTVRAAVARLKRELDLERRDVPIVALHLPGAEAQVDFGLAEAIIAGERTRVSLFHLRLSHSGEAVHVAYPTEGAEAFFEGHVIAFERLGGVPGLIRYDNASTLVTRILRGRDRQLTPGFTALRSHYGFDSFFCEPGARGAHEKGGVEGEVGRFRRRHLVPLPRVASLAELNERLAEADRADLARHIERRRSTVGEDATIDRAALLPLPAEPFDPARIVRVRVDAKARVCVRQSWYSVPARLAGRELIARLGGTALEVLDGARLIARHERTVVRGSQTLVLDHYLEILARKPGAMPGALATHQARERGVLSGAHERFWKRARRRLGDAAGTRALIEVLLLHRSLPFPAVHAALDAADRIGSVDAGLVAIEARRIAEGRGPTGAVVDRPALRRFDRDAPLLTVYDGLLAEGGR
ncbi:MAG: IS21 family transposase [Acidimicrobiia bacterium]|nr:IS21 family transposase [Acidimicrobiia bacterium]